MPDFQDHVRRHLPSLAACGAREAEIVEELALELEARYERALRNGLTTAEAWQEVTASQDSWQELGTELRAALDEPVVAEPPVVQRRNRLARWWEESSHDLRYAARQLVKSPGFTMVAVLMLALGIGANTAIFSLLNAIVLRQLPVQRPQELLFFGKGSASGSTSFIPHGSTQVFSYSFFQEFRQKNQVFSDVAAIQSFLVSSHGRVAGGREMEPIQLELVSGSYFHTLGVHTAFGRLFTDADDQTPGGHPIAVASFSWWHNRFGADASLGDQTVTIGSTVYTIVGVAPPGFFGMTVGQAPNLWVPLAMQKEASPDQNGLDERLFQCLHLVGRLKPGVSQAQAQAHTNLLFRQILRSYFGAAPSLSDSADIQRARIDLTPAATGRSELRKEFSSPLQILMVVVVLVLLVACANVANLLLARASVRQRELAVRMSMGAERPRLIRQLLAESTLLGSTGAVLGVAFAWSASRLLLAMVSTGSELVPIQVTPDLGVLGFTMAVTILTVLLFGTAPALRATKLDLAPSLRAGRGVVATALRSRLTRGLIVGQVALSLVLLAGAGLFLRSLVNVMDVNLGFDRQNVLRFRLDAAAAGYQSDDRLDSVMQRVEERVASLPGIRAASFALSVFDGGGWSGSEVVADGLPRAEGEPSVDFNLVGPSYFDVMKMPLLVGRGFSPHDNLAGRKVAIVNETLVKTHLRGASPLGRTINIGDDPALQSLEVVGVVKDAKYKELEEKQMPAVFFPHAQHRGQMLRFLVVRYAGDPGVLTPAIRRTIGEVDANLPVSDVRTLSQMVDDFTLNRRLVAQLSMFFGILAALLASIGIYGVMSYGIARRTNEFGVRMALGAARWNVLWVVLRETLALTAGGAVIGVILALSAGRLVESVLFGVAAADPLVLGLAVLAMILVAVLAGYLPARRATRIAPSVALRYE